MMMRASPLSRARGFTLVEVMVAMAIVAVALPALLFSLYQQLDGTEYLRDRTLASWVAANKLSELQLIVTSTGDIPSGELSGEARLADRDWQWTIVQLPTELPGFVRVEIGVGFVDQDKPLHTTIAFLTPANAGQNR